MNECIYSLSLPSHSHLHVMIPPILLDFGFDLILISLFISLLHFDAEFHPVLSGYAYIVILIVIFIPALIHIILCMFDSPFFLRFYVGLSSHLVWSVV